MRFALFFTQPRAASDDLLELGHGADHFVEHDELCHFTVGTGGEQLGGRCNDGTLGTGGNEVFQLTFSVCIAAGDPHHIIRVFAHHIGIEIYQFFAHPLGGIFGRAEHDGLCHAVGALEIARDLRGDLPDAVFDDDAVIVIAVCIDTVGNLFAVDIPLPFFRPPAVADIGGDINDFERRKEAVFNTLFETVCIDGLAEVAEIGNILCFLRRGGHADLRCRFEIVKDPAPAALLLGRTAVAFVHDDEIKEIRRKQLAEMLPVIVAHKLLIEGKIHLMRGNGRAVILGEVYLMNNFFKRGKVLLNGLIHKNVAVGQIKDLSFRAGLQQPVNDLERRIGFTGAGRHNEQKTVLPARDRVYRPVNGNALIITRGIGALAGVIWLVNYRFLLRRQRRFAPEALDQFSIGGKFVHSELALLTGEKIVFGKAVAVGTEGKRKIKHPCICHRLLQAKRHAVIVVFCLHHGNRVIRVQVQQIIGALGLFTENQIALDVDFPVGQSRFHRYFSDVPLGGNCRGDILELDVLFRHPAFA